MSTARLFSVALLASALTACADAPPQLCNDDSECAPDARCLLGECALSMTAPVPDLGDPGVDGVPVDDGDGTDDDDDKDTAPWADWGVQHALVIDADGAELAEGFVALLSLDAAQVAALLAQPSGADLRFVTDAGEVLPHDLETFDGEGARIWVRLPGLSASSSPVSLYSSNPSAQPADAASAWQDYASVWHLAGDASDATSLADATVVGGATFSSGFVGDGVELDGLSGHLDLGADLNHLAGASAATVSFWVRPRTMGGELVGFSVGAPTPANLSRLGFSLKTDGTVELFGRALDDAPSDRVTTTTALPVDAWSWLCGVVDLEENRLRLYIDGVEAAVAPGMIEASAFPSTPSQGGAIGADDDGASLFYDGKIDEVRASTGAWSAERVAAQHRAMRGELLLLGDRSIGDGTF
jgi:hypothetical protein